MNTRLSLLVLALLMAINSNGQNAENNVTETILSGYSAKKFTSGKVSKQDVDLILKCGMKTPSARNSQLWRFTVVKNENLMGEIVRGSATDNVIIIVSGAETSQEGIDVDFDCALATENMYVAAQSLGLGAHIYTGPIRKIKERMEAYGIPDGYRPIAVLRVGHIEEAVDGVSSASPRKDKEEVVNYVE